MVRHPDNQAASLLALPVVSLAMAREVLRPAPVAEREPYPQPPLSVSNVVLGAFMEALFEASPAFADTVVLTIEEAALSAHAEQPFGPQASAALAAAGWLKDLRALVAPQQGEA